VEEAEEVKEEEVKGMTDGRRSGGSDRRKRSEGRMEKMKQGDELRK
jgi:hypothetical protein